MIFLYQRERGLLAYPLNTGYIVARVAHKSLDLKHFSGRYTVNFHDLCGCVEHVLLVSRKIYGNAVGYELEGVAVTRSDYALVPGHITGMSKCAEYIVRLIALALDDLNAESAQQIFDIRELHEQLVGHGLSARLVAVKSLMAECGRFEIKRGCGTVGLICCDQLKIDIQKTGHGIGKNAFLIGKQPYSVECTVYDAVAVYRK